MAAVPVPSLWQQVVSVGRYYWPRLQSQVAWYAISSLVIGILMAVASHYEFGVSYGLLTGVLSLMMIFAPLAFARYNSRAMDITVPASWQAKSIFMIGYTAVIIPFVTMCLPVLIEIIFPGGVSLKTMMLRMNPFGNDEIPDWVGMLLSTRLNIYMNGVLPAMFTLFFVVTFRHNVVTKAIVWDVVVGAVVYIAIMAYTVVHIVRGMSEYLVDRVDLEPSEIEAFTDSMVHDMMLPIITGTIVGYVVTTVVMAVLIVLKLKKRQI